MDLGGRHHRRLLRIGGKITKRVWTPPQGGDYAPFIRQLPRPNQVDGYFWLVGGANTGAALTAFEQAYGPVNPRQHSGNLFLYFLGNFGTVAPKLVGAYMGGFGTAQTGELKTAQARSMCEMRQVVPRTVADINDGFFYNYWNAAWAMVQDSTGRRAQSARTAAGVARTLRATSRSPTVAFLRLDSRRQAIQDQQPLQIARGSRQ